MIGFNLKLGALIQIKSYIQEMAVNAVNHFNDTRRITLLDPSMVMSSPLIAMAPFYFSVR